MFSIPHFLCANCLDMPSSTLVIWGIVYSCLPSSSLCLTDSNTRLDSREFEHQALLGIAAICKMNSIPGVFDVSQNWWARNNSLIGKLTYDSRTVAIVAMTRSDPLNVGCIIEAGLSGWMVSWSLYRIRRDLVSIFFPIKSRTTIEPTEIPFRLWTWAEP